VLGLPFFWNLTNIENDECGDYEKLKDGEVQVLKKMEG